MGYTTDDLITSVKNRAMIPDASSGSLSPQSLLQFATEELQGPIVSLILSAREQYFATYQDTAISAGVSTYAIPSRAVGGLLDVPQYMYGNYVAPLTPIEPSEVATTNQSIAPLGFYFQNNSVVLYPTPSASQGTLRMRYYQRPSRLEQTASCALVSSFDTIAKTVTVASIPSTWTTGTILDFVPQTIPYTPYGLSSAATGVTGTTISFSSLPSVLAVGDWIALAEFTPIPEIPQEFFPVLAQATACKALEALGNLQSLELAQAKLKEYQDSAIKMITPRDRNGPKKVCSNWRYF